MIKEFGLTEEEFAAHIEETQALIATCMAEAGFEYIPADVETVARRPGRGTSRARMTRRRSTSRSGGSG